MTYRLFSQPEPVSALGCWEPNVAPFTHVVGYSLLGHFFLINAENQEFVVLYPFQQAYKNYGPFASVTAFEEAVLKDSGFSEYVLRPQHQASIRALIGESGEAEIYIPQPYPFLGGSEEPYTYEKGNVWVFAELVGMSHGFT